MPRSKNPRSYPQEFITLVTSIPRPQGLRLPMPDKQAAQAMRLDFYGFRRSLSTRPGDKALYDQAQELELRVECEPARPVSFDDALQLAPNNTKEWYDKNFRKTLPEKWYLTFQHKDDTPSALALREALKTLGDQAISPPPPVAAPEHSEAQERHEAQAHVDRGHVDRGSAMDATLKSLGYGTTGNFAALLSRKPPTDEGGSGPQGGGE